eukprot:1358833-Amorphochlora_amoeboformis.AAC.1
MGYSRSGALQNHHKCILQGSRWVTYLFRPPHNADEHSFRIIMVYDVTSMESFEHVDEWLNEVDRFANENTCKLLVGNKADLTEERKVAADTARALAQRLNIQFLETSAK